MYHNHFGLRARPFRTTPDVDAYYPASTHETALHTVRQALQDDEGVVLVQGEAGTGKTLLAHLLIESLPEQTRSVFLTHGRYANRAELMQAILFDLGLPYRGLSEQELRLALTQSCLEHFRDGGRTLIIADEAHLLSARQLEELRLLSNLEGKDGRAIQVVLFGLPTISERIEKPSLQIFRQRLGIECRLEPLGIEESADYLLHQIRRAGGRPEQLLGEDVLDILSHASRGLPRVLNQAAHTAFKLAQEAGTKLVDAEAAVEAINRLGLDEGAEEPPPASNAALEPEPLPSQPALAPIPVQPAPTVSIQMSREGEPPMFVYGGAAQHGATAMDGPRGWQAPRQRAG